MRLTDRTTASAVTKNDYIHVVITGDTSQSPEGSSYKAQIGLIPELYKLPIPSIKLSSDGSILVPTLNANNTIGSDIELLNPPTIIVDNLTQEQLDNHVFIEMVQYKKKRGRKNLIGPRLSKGGGYVIQPRIEDDGLGNPINELQKRIMNYYGKTITTRGGILTDYLTISPLAVNRMNHYEVNQLSQIVNLSDYFKGRFTYINLSYIDSGGSGNSVSGVPVPSTNRNKSSRQRTKSGNSGTSYKLCYSGNISSLYVAFRYIMFDPYANGGKGQFVEGPLSKTIKVCNKYFPLVKTLTDGRCGVNPKFTGVDKPKIKFSFVS